MKELREDKTNRQLFVSASERAAKAGAITNEDVISVLEDEIMHYRDTINRLQEYLSPQTLQSEEGVIFEECDAVVSLKGSGKPTMITIYFDDGSGADDRKTGKGDR